MGQRGQQRKHRRCQPATPQRPRAVEVLRATAGPRPARSEALLSAECASHPQTASAPVQCSRDSPEPCGTAGGVWDRKALSPPRRASLPRPDATRHLALESSRSRADGAVAFGNQLRRWRGRKRSSRGITIARRPIPSPPNPPTMRPHVDLQQLGIFGGRHPGGRLSTERTCQRFHRQRDELLHTGR